MLSATPEAASFTASEAVPAASPIRSFAVPSRTESTADFAVSAVLAAAPRTEETAPPTAAPIFAATDPSAGSSGVSPGARPSA